MAKMSVLKWKKEDEKNLRKAISDFNKKVRKLSKGKKDSSYLPAEIDYEKTKDLIKTRSELNRVMRSLGRFKGREAYKKVTLPSGEKLTAWEKKEISYQKAQAVRRIKRRMAEVKNVPYMGNEEYQRLSSTLKSIQNLYKKKGKEFARVVSRIENLGSSDYDMRRAYIYKENYLSMFKKTFFIHPQYEEIYKKLEAIENPITFYETILNMRYGENLADISFMYDAKNNIEAVNILASELGIREEDLEEFEVEEGE